MDAGRAPWAVFAIVAAAAEDAVLVVIVMYVNLVWTVGAIFAVVCRAAVHTGAACPGCHGCEA